MPFHEALALRLSAMKPSKQQMTAMLAEEPLQLTPGVADLIATLQSRNQKVYFVSGGCCQPAAWNSAAPEPCQPSPAEAAGLAICTRQASGR